MATQWLTWYGHTDGASLGSQRDFIGKRVKNHIKKWAPFEQKSPPYKQKNSRKKNRFTLATDLSQGDPIKFCNVILPLWDQPLLLGGERFCQQGKLLTAKKTPVGVSSCDVFWRTVAMCKGVAPTSTFVSKSYFEYRVEIVQKRQYPLSV